MRHPIASTVMRAVRAHARGITVIVLFTGAALPCSAQVSKPQPETLTNAGVIALVAAKLPDEVIIAKIEVTSAEFDLSTAGLIELNKGKVPSTIIKAMLAKAAGGNASAKPAPIATQSTPPAPTSAPKLADLDNGVPTEPGIYIVRDSSGQKAYTLLEPTSYTQGKTGGFLKSALTYGLAKTTIKAVVRGATANAVTESANPEFVFVFEKTGAGLSNSGGLFFGNGVTSPNEFTLIKLRVSGGSRETTVLSSNVFGSQSGTSDRAVMPFAFVRIRPGLYKVAVKVSLEPGEYCWISAAGFQVPQAGMVGAASATRLWDFAVR